MYSRLVVGSSERDTLSRWNPCKITAQGIAKMEKKGMWEVREGNAEGKKTGKKLAAEFIPKTSSNRVLTALIQVQTARQSVLPHMFSEHSRAKSCCVLKPHNGKAALSTGLLHRIWQCVPACLCTACGSVCLPVSALHVAVGACLSLHCMWQCVPACLCSACGSGCLPVSALHVAVCTYLSLQ